MPILAILAIGLTLLAWFAPLPVLRPPKAPAPRVVPTPDSAPSPSEQQASVPHEPWLPLAEVLDSLREKAPEPALAEGNSAPVEQAAPPLPAVRPLGWRYKGTIDGPGSRAALVIFSDNRTRFVFEGQRLVDSADPGSGPIVVRQITDDSLILDRGGQEERLPLEKSELANPLVERLRRR